MSTTLVKCPDCHKSISVAAASCPKCGRPFQLGELAALIPPPPPPLTPGMAAVSTLTLVFMIVGAVVIGIVIIAFC
jgi:predicted amidophosphoribosyltransferase